jgi:hypothetical protein
MKDTPCNEASNVIRFRKITEHPISLEDVDGAIERFPRSTWDFLIRSIADSINRYENTFNWRFDRKSFPYTKLQTGVVSQTVTLSMAEVYVDQQESDMEWATLVIQGGFLFDFPSFDAESPLGRDGTLLTSRLNATIEILDSTPREMVLGASRILDSGTAEKKPCLAICEMIDGFACITHQFVDGTFSRLLYKKGVIEMEHVPNIEPQRIIPFIIELQKSL